MYDIETEHLIANHALDHARRNEAKFKLIFEHLDWAGEYLLQAGHNIAYLEEGLVLEQITITLSDNFPPSTSRDRIIEEFKPVCWPFFTIIYTPDETIEILFAGPETMRERYSGGRLEAQTDAGGAGSGEGSGGGSNIGGSGGTSEHRNRDSEEASQPHGANRGPSGNGGGEDIPTHSQSNDSRLDMPEHAIISFPFTSTLLENSRQMFQIDGLVEINIQRNHQSNHMPDGVKWSGPWVGVCLNRLITISGGSGELSYKLALFESRIDATAKIRPSNLGYNPVPTSAQDMILRQDNTQTFSVQGIISTTPSFQMGVQSARVFSTERPQPRWRISSFAQTGQKRFGMLWKYLHNDFFDDESSHIFNNRPSIVFGRTLQREDSWPKIDVEVVMCWSSEQRKILKRAKGLFNSNQPGFTTMFHRAVVSVNLMDFELPDGALGLTGSVSNCTADDTIPPRTAQSQTSMCYNQSELTIDRLVSAREVGFKRAVYGQMCRLDAGAVAARSSSVLSGFDGSAH